MSKLLRWTPRILSIGLVALLYMLSLDVFEFDAHWTEILIGFLIHNIPAFILTLVIILSWKRPWIGSIAFAIAGLFYIIFMMIRMGSEAISAILILSVPSLISSALYFLDYRQIKK